MTFFGSDIRKVTSIIVEVRFIPSFLMDHILAFHRTGVGIICMVEFPINSAVIEPAINLSF